jgi:siroheme synthase
VREAKSGRRVLRLVFGQGADETDYARRQGVELIAVPGIMSPQQQSQAKVAV